MSAVARVADVPVLMRLVHYSLDRFRRAGVLKICVYRALDDPQEVLILHEIDDEVSARNWIERPDEAAEWMSAVGLPSYPTVLVGTLAHLRRIPGMTADEGH